LKIIEDFIHKTRVIAGYDAVKKWIVVSFRGSDNTMNILEDVNFPKTDYVRPGCTNCSVHEGFYHAYTSL